VAEQQLNLLQLPASGAAKLRGSSTQVVWPNVLQSGEWQVRPRQLPSYFLAHPILANFAGHTLPEVTAGMQMGAPEPRTFGQSLAWKTF
jgi:hypothetical protein